MEDAERRLANLVNAPVVLTLPDMEQVRVRQNAREWGADAERVGVAAWSLGGALLSPLLRENPPYLRCILAFYPMLDLQQWAPPAAEPAVLATLKAFSPGVCLQAQQTVPPLFIARAGRDSIPLLNDGLDRFVAGALAANVPLTLMNHPEGVHGFDSQNDDDRSREILRAAIAFAGNHLGVALTPK